MSRQDDLPVVQGMSLDLENESAPLMGGGGEGAVSYTIGDPDNSPKKRFSVATDGDVDAQVLDAGVEGRGSLRQSIKDLKESIAGMNKPEGAKPEEEGANPLYVVGVVCAFLFCDAMKPITQKLGTTGIHSGVFTNLNQTISVMIAFVLTLIIRGFATGLGEIFNWATFKNYIMPTAFFSVSQLFYVVQSTFLMPAQQKVLAQLRIPITALMAKFIMGHGYTSLQWMMIVSITIAVFEFQMLCMPNESPLGDNMVGFIFSVFTNLMASCGSLAGEKTMKATKKQPFVLQKAQFAFWEWIFGFGATLLVGPLSGMLVDVMDGNTGPVLERAHFVKQWVAFPRGIEWTTSEKGALSNLPYVPKFTTFAEVEAPALADGAALVPLSTKKVEANASNESLDNKDKTKMVLTNKMDSKWWFADVDERNFAEVDVLAGGETGKDTRASLATFGKMNKYLKGRRSGIKARFTDEKNKPTTRTYTKFSSLKEKIGLFNGDFKNKGHMMAHHKEQLKNFDTDLYLDTKWMGANAFGMTAASKHPNYLKKNWVLTIADQERETDDREKSEKNPNGVEGFFRSLSVQRRDSPYEIVDNMKLAKTIDPKNDPNTDKTKTAKLIDDKGVYTASVDDYTMKVDYNKDHHEELFKKLKEEVVAKKIVAAIRDYTQLEGEKKKIELLTDDATITKAFGLELTEDHAIVTECAKGDKASDKCIADVKAAVDPNMVANKLMPKFVEYKWNRNTLYNQDRKVDGKAAATVLGGLEKGNLRQTHTRNAVLTAYFVKDTNKKTLDYKKTVVATESKRIVIDFKLDDEKKQLSFDDGSKGKKKIIATLVSVKRENYEGLMKIDANGFEKKSDPTPYGWGKTKEEKDEAKKKSDEESSAGKAIKAAKAFADAVKNADKWIDVSEKETGLYGSEDELDKLNDVAKLFMNREDFKTKLLDVAEKGGDDAKFELWSYPGSAAGGGKDGKGNLGCSRKTCWMTGGEWNDNFRYVQEKLFWIPAYSDAAAPMKSYPSLKSMSESEKQDPFYFSTYVPWTNSPLPAKQITFWFLMAIATNIGQNWMSALLSKTLSSLWKNIFAAVALALIVILQALFMDPKTKAITHDWWRILFGTFGVLLTSMIFSQAPKAPKEEPKKDGEKKA